VINTMLASPQPQAIELLYPGLFLEVALFGGAVVVRHQGVLVGGLASPLVHLLRACIEQGTTYRAKVVSKNDALVRLQVSAVSIYS
jgi:hypothetical protein